MEEPQRRTNDRYGSGLKNGDQQSPRVDPGNPRPSQLPPPIMEGASPSNGPARTTSRKKIPSGTATNRGTITSDIPNLPAAPEVPNSTPSSYRPPPTEANGAHSLNTYPGSFAQRAAILTGRSLPPDPNSGIAEPSNARPTIKGERRTSLNRPIGGVYSEIQQHARDSWGKSPTSPRRISFPGTPQEAKSKSLALPTPQDNPPVSPLQTDPTPENDQVKPSRSISVSTRNASDKWASDRSPLQKLEVKLSDISKEEKRARVEQAEQRLRESKLAAQEKPVNYPGLGKNTQSRAPAADTVVRSSSSSHPRTRIPAPIHSRQQAKPAIYDTEFTQDRPQRRATSGQYPDRGVRFRNEDHLEGSDTESDVNEADTGFHKNENLRVSKTWAPARSQPQQPRMLSTSRQVPQEQKNLYTNKTRPSKSNDSAAAHGGSPDPVSSRDVSTGQTPKHEVPPLTAAGIRARQKVGFSTDPQLSAEVPTQRKHHLSKILHHDHGRTPEPEAETQAKAVHLDEWKQGGVARLTEVDFQDDPLGDDPWWDKQSSSARSRSQRNSVGFQDPYQQGNGKCNTISSAQPVGNLATPSHTRQYVALEESKGSTTARLKGNLSSLSRRLNGRSAVGLPSTYSYSCSSLADHDPSHLNHICEPYLSKELMKSMRSVRIRPVPASTTFTPPLFLKCGPLLRYTGMKREKHDNNRQSSGGNLERETWRGSVMIVTSDADSKYDSGPILRLFPEPMEKLPPPQQQHTEHENSENLPHHYLDPVAGLPKLSRTGKTIYVKPVDDLEHAKDLSQFEGDDDGLFEDFRSAAVPTAYGTPEYRPGQNGPSPRQSRSRPRQKRGHRVRGVRLHAERGVTFWRFNLEVELQAEETRIAYSINNGPSVGFWVPGRGRTMNVMFHSCNGFSLSVNPDDFSGPDPLWRDVLNSHQTLPFHVMIGGGDQIYNDAVMKQSPLLREWLDIKNPHHKHEAELTPALLEELETFYLERYSMWFSQGLFGMANAQIPMVNVWDDHDIIDGFGSYPHHFMSTPVFCGLGSIAFKYYMLFQHQSVPAETTADEPSWLLGASPGPYINELSRSVYLSLGKHVAFLGLDCRTERMREEVVSEATYDIVFERCRREIEQGDTKHLIVLLGVPIAYPRLVWLESLLTSRALDPIKAVGRMGMFGNVMNKFDGGVEILDDLDDHWTARNHKRERNRFIQELQELAADLSVRVTILGGDVHLAAAGQFFSNPKLKIPKDRDHRYMPNVVSSAIVNTPPPEIMSDVLNKRNKTHHLDEDTDENMIPMFSHDVDGKPRNNKRLLPRRNWCSIQEYLPGSTPPPTPPASEPESPTTDTPARPSPLQRTLSLTRGDIKPGNLIRRLSGRGPPNTYLSQGYGTPSPPPSPPDDDILPQQPHVRRSSTAPTSGPTPQKHVSAPLQRPIFLRRPTNLSEKAAHRGDPEDTSNHINLENGLDITLHCEIDQKNPGGETIPYRILVPALYYEGEGDENTVALHRPNLLKRLSSLRGKRPHEVNDAQDRDAFSEASMSESESDIEENRREESVRPRRWSFGLEKRRKYRDQTPPKIRDSPELQPLPQRNPDIEAQRLGDLRQRPQRQPQPQVQPKREHEDTSRQVHIPEYERIGRGGVPPSRQAKRFEALDGANSEEESPPPRERMDSIDYHDYVDSGNKRFSNGAPERRLSKAEKMLGNDVPLRLDNRGDQSGYFGPVGDDEAATGPNSKRSSGYTGIEAYTEEKKGWRRSLKFF